MHDNPVRDLTVFRVVLRTNFWILGVQGRGGRLNEWERPSWPLLRIGSHSPSHAVKEDVHMFSASRASDRSPAPEWRSSLSLCQLDRAIFPTLQSYPSRTETSLFGGFAHRVSSPHRLPMKALLSPHARWPGTQTPPSPIRSTVLS